MYFKSRSTVLATLRRSVFASALMTMAGAVNMGAQGTPNPVPLISQPLAPSSVAPGGPAIALIVNGTGFVSGATVKWNGAARTSSFVSSSRLIATIPTQDVALAGTAAVAVSNPSPGGGVSNVVFFNITNPAPALVFSSLTWQGAPGFGPVIAADFDGDGKLDLALTIAATNQVCILLGNGTGTFKDPISYALSAGLSRPIAADFNGDGKLDLAVASAGDDTVSILMGNGDGTFQTPLIFTVGHTDHTFTKPVALIAGDFDRDGKLDLAFALQLSGTVGILLGNGDGTFRNLVEYAANKAPTGITVEDFNHDGMLDLAVSGPGTISILLGIGDGTFQPQMTVPVDSGFFALASAVENVLAADLNKDGKIDLVAVMDNGIGLAGVAVLLGNGDGTFQPNVNYANASDVHDAVVADLHADGKLDLAFLHDSSKGLSILPGNGDGTFQSEIQIVTGILPDGGPDSLVAADFNQDGRTDLAMPFLTSFNGTNLTMLLQGQFPALSYPANLNFGQPAIGVPTGITVNLLDTGLANVSISNMALSGPNASNFSMNKSTCGATLAPSATCNFIVNFTPISPGTFNAALVITDNAPGSPHTIRLSGGTADGPGLVLSSSSLSFAGQQIGNPSPSQAVTLTSSGTADLTVTQIAVTGINSGDFAATNTYSSSIAVGASCQINLAFTPTAAGARVADVSISYNGLGSPQTIHLTGNPISGPGVVISPSAVSFAGQILGIPSSAQTITLVSAGTATVSMSGIALTGADAGDFAETNTCSPNLAVNASCQISVTFTPTFVGTSTATVQIADNTPASPHTISLTGLGQALATPTGSVSPSSLIFAAQMVGTTSASQIVTVTNTGTVSLTVFGPTIVGANPGDFVSVGACNSVQLAVGETCQITMSFRPLVAGARTATLSISTNSPAGPLIVSLSGTGIAPPLPAATVVPSSIAFPSQFVGTSGLPQNVILTNIGNASFNIASVAVSPADFGQLNSCGNSLAAGASCSIGIFFDPTVSGARAGTLTITDGAANSPQTVPLSGTGQDFSVAAAAPASATVKAGQTAIYMLTLAPDGGFSQPVTFTCSGAPALSSCVVAPNPASLNGSTVTATVTVSTTAASLAVHESPKSWPPVIVGYRGVFLVPALLALLTLWVVWRREKRVSFAHAGAVLLVCGMLTVSACGRASSSGGGGQPGTATGTYTLTVTATFSSGTTTLSHQTSLTLVVQ